VSTKIVSYKDYVAGWLDSSIHDFIAMLSPAALSTKYALITCLDSHPNPASLVERSPELTAVANKLAIRGSGLLVPTKVLLKIESTNRILFAFDEVWFFPNKDMRPKPASLSLVGPSRLNQSRLEKIGKWMADNSCSLALGGGEGLNFVVRAHGLVRSLLGFSIEQPESAFAANG
jgi:hypothetical protein